MLLDLLNDEMYLVLHLLLSVQDLKTLLLVYEVVEYVGEPNGAVGRHQSHQIDPVFDYQLYENF